MYQKGELGRGLEQDPARHLDSEICEYPIQLQHFAEVFVLFLLVSHSDTDKKSPIVQGYRRHLEGTGNKNRELAVSRRHILTSPHQTPS
jgi:hypothetical protein